MIILFGGVGSGKSEQAKRMVTRLKCPHVSTSQLLKQQANPHWQKLMASGILVPDKDTVSLLEPELKKIRAESQEFILDGAPRSIGQAEWLVNKIRIGEVKLTAIIHLKVSRETTVARMLNRGREDDTAEVIGERFREYETKTIPVLDYLRSQGYEVIEIDGEWSADVVEQQIWKVLEGKIAPQDR